MLSELASAKEAACCCGVAGELISDRSSSNDVLSGKGEDGWDTNCGGDEVVSGDVERPDSTVCCSLMMS